MAVLDNTILAENIAKAQDIEMITRFNGDMNRLTEILGLFDPEIVAAGTARAQQHTWERAAGLAVAGYREVLA